MRYFDENYEIKLTQLIVAIEVSRTDFGNNENRWK
jgi:hypothetical protein